jgi:hypothetical protein
MILGVAMDEDEAVVDIEEEDRLLQEAFAEVTEDVVGHRLREVVGLTTLTIAPRRLDFLVWILRIRRKMKVSDNISW